MADQNKPMDKDEILKLFGSQDLHHSYSITTVLDAMDEYAKQQCLEFEKYLLKTNIAYESVYTAFLEYLNKQK